MHEGSWYTLEMQNQLKMFPKCCKLFLWCFSKTGGEGGGVACNPIYTPEIRP